jgi:serine/threonine-protein kinase
MGSVWEGVHTSLGTRVAVKFIETAHASSPEARSRFENEARAAARLRSKHVVQVYDHGLTDDGRPFIVMEFLAGEPLDRRLDRVGRLPPADTAKIIHQVCRALGRAHEAGIVHRDLKPENVFLVWDEEDGADVVKVVDFGIAKFTDGSVGVSSATRTGSVLGTPYYMSPEQARGLRSVDHRSDLWSVGVIAYRCLVGSLPFEGEALGDLLVKICTAPLPIPSQHAPGIPMSFDAWFARALDREPAQRFASAALAAEALNQAFGFATRVPMTSATGGQALHADGVAPGLTTPMHVGAMTPGAGLGSFQSGVHPGVGTGGGYGANLEKTDIPFSATPGLPRRPSRALLFTAIFGACLLLGVAVAVAAKMMRGTPAAVAPEPSAHGAVLASAQPTALKPELEVAPEVSAQPAVAKTPKPAASVAAEKTKSAARSSPRTTPRLPAPRTESPRPKPPVKPAPGAIDVGY